MRQPPSWPWTDQIVGLLEIVANHAALIVRCTGRQRGPLAYALALDEIVDKKSPFGSAVSHPSAFL